jgi:hypothetical protein
MSQAKEGIFSSQRRHACEVTRMRKEKRSSARVRRKVYATCVEEVARVTHLYNHTCKENQSYKSRTCEGNSSHMCKGS